MCALAAGSPWHRQDRHLRHYCAPPSTQWHRPGERCRPACPRRGFALICTRSASPACFVHPAAPARQAMQGRLSLCSGFDLLPSVAFQTQGWIGRAFRPVVSHNRFHGSRLCQLPVDLRLPTTALQTHVANASAGACVRALQRCGRPFGREDRGYGAAGGAVMCQSARRGGVAGAGADPALPGEPWALGLRKFFLTVGVVACLYVQVASCGTGGGGAALAFMPIGLKLGSDPDMVQDLVCDLTRFPITPSGAQQVQKLDDPGLRALAFVSDLI